ncbi:MAG: MFS transporter [Candidatus Margulisiibacteriota bacterium]
MNSPVETVSAWSPFKQSVFRALWIATLVSNVGTWIQNVGAAWLMTSMSKSPVLVALVQVATTLPMFLLSLPAGALADIIDRRRLLLFTQGWMTAAAAILGALTLAALTNRASADRLPFYGGGAFALLFARSDREPLPLF